MYHEDEIRKMSNALTLEKKAELDIWKVPEDLEALYQEIVQALTEKSPDNKCLMAEYSVLMQKEQDMYDPFAAYTAGKEYCNEDYWKAFISYYRLVMEDPDYKKHMRERDRLFYRMCDILAGDERRLLLTDYNEIFRQYHGIVSFHINRFFDLGYYEAKNGEGGTEGL